MQEVGEPLDFTPQHLYPIDESIHTVDLFIGEVVVVFSCVSTVFGPRDQRLPLLHQW